MRSLRLFSPSFAVQDFLWSCFWKGKTFDENDSDVPQNSEESPEGKLGNYLCVLSREGCHRGCYNVTSLESLFGRSSPRRLMSMQAKLVLASATLAFLLLPNSAAGQRRQSRKQSPKQEQVAPAPQPPVPPPPPPTPEQMPASPPQVTFNNGQLTIVAQNSTLGDILRAVRAKTGAAVEVPGNATERVVANIGPGPAREVLASLLNGSHFNYVMLGSATQADMVDRIILTSKSGAEPTTAASGPTPVPNQPQYNGLQAADGRQLEPEEMQNNDDVAQDAPEPENEGAPAADEQANQPNGQQGVKTPEQLLRELQQQQQQIQQQQQGAPQGFPTPQNPNPQQNQPPQ